MTLPLPIDSTDANRLTNVQQTVDQYLKNYLDAQILEAGTISPRYERLWQAATRLVLSGGKRLRPYMLLLAYRSFGGTDESKLIPAAAAWELLHVAMLVHDDIIDRDDTRYGVDNVYGQYLKQYQDLPDVDRQHFANSAAMLIGDALIAEAHRLLAKSSDDPLLLAKAQAAFSTAIMHAIGGELLDTESSILPNDGLAAVDIARHKTASYSFAGPLRAGAHLAGADEVDIEALMKYADSLGIAFQLTDDLLGTFGSTDKTGKSNDTDLKEGKRTYIIEQFNQAADQQAKSEFYESFARQDMTSQQAERLRHLLTKAGAVASTEQAISEYAFEARQAITLLAIDDVYRPEYIQLISLCVDREK